MLNSGKKIRALLDKKINIITLVLSENVFLNETKNHNPPFKLNGRSLRRSPFGIATFSLVILYIIVSLASFFFVPRISIQGVLAFGLHLIYIVAVG
jgi:hypothetical protein